ncbi:COX15/CtaA family protein [Halovulum sp. GXIMD14793]
MIQLWLMALFVLVIVMIGVGGLTRLTDSGLSITEWKPVTGVIPPMSAAAWAVEFGHYKATPEFQLQNSRMTLDEFKFIYWWEWGHRFLGRIIGLVWAIGFFWFLARGRLPRGTAIPYLMLGILGGFQATVGWWMVASGLTADRVDVASYRLAAHLGLAFVILGLIGWHYLRLGMTEAERLQARRRREAGLPRMAVILLALAFVQILLGALVAGIDAGRTYTEWPLMAGGWLPPDPLELEPVWRNFFENPGTVQFVHRCGAYLVTLVALLFWWRARHSGLQAVRRSVSLVMLAVLAQVLLGIVTLVHISPWHLAILHQLTAVLIFMLIVSARHVTLYPPEQRIARG